VDLTAFSVLAPVVEEEPVAPVPKRRLVGSDQGKEEEGEAAGAGAAWYCEQQPLQLPKKKKQEVVRVYRLVFYTVWKKRFRRFG